jgi:hypothetical protein
MGHDNDIIQGFLPICEVAAECMRSFVRFTDPHSPGRRNARQN